MTGPLQGNPDMIAAVLFEGDDTRIPSSSKRGSFCLSSPCPNFRFRSLRGLSSLKDPDPASGRRRTGASDPRTGRRKALAISTPKG
jgi:hypothetical protein